ncbi:MAG: 5-(carboxyamino)imidazole ribonucleotide synthase, partial [Rhodosalinus sp.]
TRHADVVMENLIGPEVEEVTELARKPEVSIHLYGKGAARPGRKMGHVNRVTGAAHRP